MSTLIMTVPKYLSFLTLACLVMLAFYLTPAMACTYMPKHPQTHYCHADYVILAMFKDQQINFDHQTITYALKERYAAFKTTAKGNETLTDGILKTSRHDSLCGVNISANRFHLIAGRGKNVDICDFVEQYEDLSYFEQKGFVKEYEKGCSCEINSETGCKWSYDDICETKLSACVRDEFSGQCGWIKTPEYEECKFLQNFFGKSLI